MSDSGGASSFDAAEFLRQTEAFSGLDEMSLKRLAESATTEVVEARHVLIAEGDLASDAYIVVTGRLEVRVSDDAGNRSVVGELGPGDVVGEMALLTGAPRSATVRALRDSLLIRLARADCIRIAREEPSVLIDLARTLVARLDRSIHERRPVRARSVVCIIPAGEGGDHRRLADGFAAALRSGMSVAVVGRDDVTDVDGDAATLDALVSFLQRAESNHDLTLLVGDDHGDAWTRLCARQADVILLVGTASGLKAWNDAERTLEELRSEDVNLSSHLVIVHDVPSPTNTRQLLEMRSVDRHHHVRINNQADVARVARIVMGTSVGLVLSGGGARGFAHLGAIRALVEAGVPIDHIGGTSIGASVAAAYAMGWDWDTMVANEQYVTVGQGKLVDLTLPVLALGRGGRLTSGIRKVFGACDIADLWFDFFCVSTDLTAGESRVHTTGPVWQAVRSSVAIPGIFPPVQADDGHVLVDGSVLDNLPVDTMRATCKAGTVIAVDLRGSVALPAADLPHSGIVSGWQVGASRLRPRRRSPELPGIIELMSATSSVAGRHSGDHADRLLSPPVQGYGVLDFASNERIIDIGYRHVRDAVEKWEPLPGA